MMATDVLMIRTGTALIQQPAIQQHPYQEYLDSNSSPPELTTSSVRFWSDYNRVFYHPRSLIQLYSDPLTATLAPLRSWTSGAELFESEDREHDVLDRDFRHFAEECDQMQGIVMVASIDDAWGGFAARYAERLRDEIGKGVLWVWGLDGTLGDDESRTRVRKCVP
jgi:Tubulin domain